MSAELTPAENRILSCARQAKPWFSICAVGEACNALGIENYREHKNYKWLGLLHCVDYRDMSPELLADIDRMVAELLTPPVPRPRLLVRAYQSIRALLRKQK